MAKAASPRRNSARDFARAEKARKARLRRDLERNTDGMTLEDHLFVQYIKNEGPRQMREMANRAAIVQRFAELGVTVDV
jgi:predicted amidohydrolase YtcJ